MDDALEDMVGVLSVIMMMMMMMMTVMMIDNDDDFSDNDDDFSDDDDDDDSDDDSHCDMMTPHHLHLYLHPSAICRHVEESAQLPQS